LRIYGRPPLYHLADIWVSDIPAFNQPKNLGEYYGKGLKTIDEFLGFLSDWFIGHPVYEEQKLFKKNI
jgi:hypothetical protein